MTTETAGAVGDEGLAAAVGRRLRIGVALTVAGVVAALLYTSLPFWQAAGLGLFYLLLPSLAVAQLPLLRVRQIERIPVYLGSMATILVIGCVALVLGAFEGGLSGLGLFWIPRGELTLWVVCGTAVGLGIISSFPMGGGLAAQQSSALVLQLIPRTMREKRLFVGLSVAAGFGEEIAYRGYAFIAIQTLIAAPWVAAGVSSAAFGVLHAYQGPAGILRTALVGFTLAVPVIMTGSLVPGIVAHALIDVVAGLLIGPRLLARVEQVQ